MLTLNDIDQASPGYTRLLIELKNKFPSLEIGQIYEKLKGFKDGTIDSSDKQTLQ